MATRNSLVLLIALLGCTHEPESIHPAMHYASRLAAPTLGISSVQVGVDISVPQHYSMQILQNVVHFRRNPLDPAITLFSQGGNDKKAIDNDGFTAKDCGGGDERIANVNGRAVRVESRPDGWVVVCVDKATPDDWPWTRVVRDVQWDGAHYQCEVEFRGLMHDEREPGYPFDHGRPSQARIAEAIAICDSMKLHTLNEAEQKLYWTGSAWTQQY